MIPKTILLLCLALALSCMSRQPANPAPESIIGVWEYVEDDVLQDVRGMSFFTEKHFAFVVNFSRGDSAGAAEILAHSGTYSMQGSIVTAQIKYSHNPALIGQNIRWVHGVDNNRATYKVLDKNGTVVESGSVRRLE